MKHQNFIRGVGEMDDRILERYHAIDTRLAHKHAGKTKMLRVMAIAACTAVLVCALAPVGMLAHPAGRAVLQGDSEALTEQLNKIDGFMVWQEQTAQKLEQSLQVSNIKGMNTYGKQIVNFGADMHQYYFLL